MNPVFLYVSNLLTPCFYLLIMRKFMNTFLAHPKKTPLRYVVWTVYYLLQTLPILGIRISPPMMLVLNIILVLVISIVSYDASLKRICIFSMLICAFWMFVEIATDILLSLFGMEGWEAQTAGSIISLMCMFFIVVIAGHYIKSRDRRDIPLQYVVAILTVPTGSIYLMHNIFKITARHPEYSCFAIASSLLLLLLIYMIFEVYDRMVDDAEAQEKNLLYEQEFELMNKQTEEREAYDADMGRLRHDMKNHMESLLGMARENDMGQMEEYIKDMLQVTSDCRPNDVSRSGNIIVDSLVNAKCDLARKEGIEFDAAVFLPAVLPFRGGHLTIIFGNLLDNALEACQKVQEEKRYIALSASYEKGVLMVSVINPYHDTLKKGHSGRYSTTKADAENHGMGLSSVEQAVETYQGQIIAEGKDGIFRVSLVMYGSDGKK